MDDFQDSIKNFEILNKDINIIGKIKLVQKGWLNTVKGWFRRSKNEIKD